MILKAWNNLGETVVSESPTRADIETAVASVDWTMTHALLVGVTLWQDDSNWADGSGSFEAGLSIMIQEDGVQYVIEKEPQELVEIVDFLELYLTGDRHRIHEALAGRGLSNAELHERRSTAESTQGGGLVGWILLAFMLAVIGALTFAFVV